MSRIPTPKSNSRQSRLQQAASQHEADYVGRAIDQDDSAPTQKRTIKQIQNDLDGASRDELDRLRRHQAQANAAFTAEEQQELEAQFKDRLYKPMTLEQVGAALDWKLDLDSLFSQFNDTAEVQRQGKRRQLLLHGFTQEDEETVRELHRWMPFQTLVQRLFRPVLSGVYTGIGKDWPLQRPLTGNQSNVIGALGHSHFNKRALNCQELAFAVEDALGAKMGQVFVHANHALFVMEWPHSKEFRLVVGFEVQFKTEDLREQVGKQTATALQTDAITLCRADLTDEAVDEMPVELADKTRLDLGWLRRALRQAFLSYVQCACAKWQ